MHNRPFLRTKACPVIKFTSVPFKREKTSLVNSRLQIEGKKKKKKNVEGSIAASIWSRVVGWLAGSILEKSKGGIRESCNRRV